MHKSKYFPWVVAAGFAISLAVVLPAFAQSNMPNGRAWGVFGTRGDMKPGIVGTVTAVDGTTLTVTGRVRPNATTTTATVYTVDASNNVQVFKNGATSTVSSIVTGDTVMVQGTVSGTNITATVIRDGMMGKHGTTPGMPPGGIVKGKGLGRGATSTPPIQGNGEPVVAGSVTLISGTILTITNASNVTYTIDTSDAKIVKNGTSTELSNLATGDNVIVQGTVNGTSVTASSVIDQGSGKLGNNASPRAPPSVSHFNFFGAFGAIGNFFKHLFGF